MSTQTQQQQSPTTTAAPVTPMLETVRVHSRSWGDPFDQWRIFRTGVGIGYVVCYRARDGRPARYKCTAGGDVRENVSNYADALAAVASMYDAFLASLTR